jgi:polygalacturonase
MKLSTLFILLFSLLTLTAMATDRQKIYVASFGAINNGKTLNTKAIQNAIDEAHNKKGIVVFSKGKYLSGSLILKSDVELMFEKGACLLGSTNPRDYHSLEIEDAPKSPKTDDNSRLALLLAHDAKNISITGEGTIDGQGKELVAIIDSLHHKGVMIDPHYTTRLSETMRPKIINFMQCKNVKVSGITIQNSSCWVQTYELCRNLTIDSVKVYSRAYWNNDGIDITDCKNVRITHCDINTGDDGICLKSYYPNYFNDNIYISNCTVRSSCNAIKLGTASIGGFKNVVIENMKVYDTYLSTIAIENVDGGFLENINVSNITAENTGNALFIRLGHRSGEKAGIMKNISITNIKVEVPSERPDRHYDRQVPEPSFSHNQFPVSITGIPNNFIKNINLQNIEIIYPGKALKDKAYIPLDRLDDVPENIKNYPEYNMFGELPSWGFYVRHVKNISMENITLKLKDVDFRPAFVFDDVENINMKNIEIPDIQTEQIILKQVKNIDLDEKMNHCKKEF